MKVHFERSFAKDIKKIYGKAMQSKLKKLIQEIESASHLPNVADVKKMEGYERFYRIRIGDYRIGLEWEAAYLADHGQTHRADRPRGDSRTIAPCHTSIATPSCAPDIQAQIPTTGLATRCD